MLPGLARRSRSTVSPSSGPRGFPWLYQNLGCSVSSGSIDPKGTPTLEESGSVEPRQRRNAKIACCSVKCDESPQTLRTDNACPDSALTPSFGEGYKKIIAQTVRTCDGGRSNECRANMSSPTAPSCAFFATSAFRLRPRVGLKRESTCCHDIYGAEHIAAGNYQVTGVQK